MKPVVAGVMILATMTGAWAAGNERIDSFSDAKKKLENQVYTESATRVTLYCAAKYDERKNVKRPSGFSLPLNRDGKPIHEKRARRIEWEHVVPAENFGRAFAEWRDGHPSCVEKGKSFKGRKCAEKANRQFQFMQADMYNLYPAIGAVNALRSNYNFQMLDPTTPSTFGSCEMKIVDKKAEPPARARGVIARTYKYMDAVYPAYKMSRAQKQLMDAWDTAHPVDRWECTRAKRIEKIQGNENPIVKAQCVKAGLW
ncbi:MAG: endonuclease [Burkholderiaceae bacterium]|nr:endonuclease [Burkholderiaceae bacterium]